MGRHFTLEYWPDDGWYVGRLKEVPGVISEAETLEELQDNIREAYQLVTDDPKELASSELDLARVTVEA